MNFIKISKNIVVIILLIFPQYVFSQREKAFEINQKLGQGINYGNMFEAPTETGWGNQWQPEYAGMISELGFSHVRIPIRWEPANRSAEVYPYTINPNFLNRIKQVVDSALNNGLYAIINMHHHEALYENPTGNKARFMSQWEQISEFFKDYPDNLLFEILNEPHGNLDADTWNIFLNDALESIRIHSPERIVVIGTGEYGGLGGLLKLEIPDDQNIILTVHYYNPFHFTHQGASWSEGSDAWMGTEWMDTETERSIMRQDFAPLVQLGEQQNIPIHIGEFGAYEKADMESRVRWTSFLSRYLESLDWSWAYWEFSAGFGIYNPTSKTYNQSLIDALLHNEMPEAFEYNATPLYKSNFQTGTNSWDLYKQGTASAVFQGISGNLKITINNGGAESWHVQIAKNQVQLYEGKKYRVSFTAKASAQRTISAYTGMTSSPWSAYSGYNGITLTDTFANYAYIFDMDVTDLSARIVFDMGKSDEDVVFSEIKLEELSINTNISHMVESAVLVYPNPVQNKLWISNADEFSIFEIYNLAGNKVYSNVLNDNSGYDISTLTSGIYVLQLFNDKKIQSYKILKQ
ncbi:MAG: cellulase family glycosylhydrolase [Mariniphaga sp.]|nr:cellulase family glycosylhydrolase [Mariniphaga sp.]